MAKICDHTSVGMFVWKANKLLLIERKKIPYGFAVPAGHVDGDKSFEESAERELKEEVNLDMIKLELIAEGRKENHCRRGGGTWHYWKLYKNEVTGDVKGNTDEIKQACWYSKEKIKKLAERTEKYNKKEISEEEWAINPGLEPVMYEWFKELQII